MRVKKRIPASTDAIDGLNADDAGIRLLAAAVGDVPPARVLLVCCGDLPGVGADATRLVLDVRETTGSVARPIVVGPGLTARVEACFEHAVVWPRAHLGKDFTRQCIARAASSLAEGGRLWCAVRKDKGAEGVGELMAALMGNVTIVRRDRRYRLLSSERAPQIDEALARQILSVRYRIEDPWLDGLVLHACPGVFSRRELDDGTRLLIEHVAAVKLAPKQVIDLGAGVGPLALWAARRWSAGVLAVESNAIAAAMCRQNAEASGLADRVQVSMSDGLPPARDRTCDLALVNPPTHADPATLGRMLAGLRSWLRPNAPAFAVVSRPGRAIEAFTSAGARVAAHGYPHYTVVEASW
jgi:16S rRNA G1207 methylase RsmC